MHEVVSCISRRIVESLDVNQILSSPFYYYAFSCLWPSLGQNFQGPLQQLDINVEIQYRQNPTLM